RQSLIRIEWASGPTQLTTAEFRDVESPSISIGALTSVAAQATTPLPIVLPSGPETLSVAFVSRAFFDMLGTTPVAGRVITAADGAPSAAPVALISERLWRRAFDGSPRALQQPLTIAERSFAI